MIATRVKNAIGSGGAFMLDPQTLATGRSLGYGGWGFYMGGRGGVLGDVDAGVVTAALGFFPESFVRKGWERAREVAPPAETLARYVEACHAWGRKHLAGAEGLERLAELLERVVRAADPAGLPLFAGWRAVALPDDPPARVKQLMHTLREHRGGHHVVAVLASGLTPLESVLAGGGAGNATFFGWPEPYADVSHLAEKRAAAEHLTDVLAERAWSVLGDDADEAVRLLDAAAATGLASMSAATG